MEIHSNSKIHYMFNIYASSSIIYCIEEGDESPTYLLANKLSYMCHIYDSALNGGLVKVAKVQTVKYINVILTP